jgi:hypothetical protein
VEKWLEDERVILLIDEINYLDVKQSDDDYELGDFVRDSFLWAPGQYHVCTSHDMHAVGSFGNILDSSMGSGLRHHCAASTTCFGS